MVDQGVGGVPEPSYLLLMERLCLAAGGGRMQGDSGHCCAKALS